MGKFARILLRSVVLRVCLIRGRHNLYHRLASDHRPENAAFNRAQVRGHTPTGFGMRLQARGHRLR
jgi:hypothetical protein